MNPISNSTILPNAENSIYRVKDITSSVVLVEPTISTGALPPNTVNQITDIQLLKFRNCTKSESLLNFTDLNKYFNFDAVTTIKALDKSLNNLSLRIDKNIKLIWNHGTSVFQILGSCNIPNVLILEVINKDKNYAGWLPHLANKKMSENYEVMLDCDSFTYTIHEPEIKKYIPSLASITRKPYPAVGADHCTYAFNYIFKFGYTASYVNTSYELAFQSTAIGNQKLISINSTNKLASFLFKDKNSCIKFNQLEYIVNFLKQNNHIKYIVDIGCGDASITLLIQKILAEEGLNVIIFAVDVYIHESTLPINLIPAQEIKNADPSSTAFIAIHPFVDISELWNEREKHYLNALIENNPGCFILTTEKYGYISSPNLCIPCNLVYTKKLSMLKENSFFQLDQLEKINQFFGDLPKNKLAYLSAIQRINKKILSKYTAEYLEFFSLAFDLYADEELKKVDINYLDLIKKIKKEDEHWWHVYQQSR